MPPKTLTKILTERMNEDEMEVDQKADHGKWEKDNFQRIEEKLSISLCKTVRCIAKWATLSVVATGAVIRADSLAICSLLGRRSK